jgi:hypothetical protein
VQVNTLDIVFNHNCLFLPKEEWEFEEKIFGAPEGPTVQINTIEIQIFLLFRLNREPRVNLDIISSVDNIAGRLQSRCWKYQESERWDYAMYRLVLSGLRPPPMVIRLYSIYPLPVCLMNGTRLQLIESEPPMKTLYRVPLDQTNSNAQSWYMVYKLPSIWGRQSLILYKYFNLDLQKDFTPRLFISNFTLTVTHTPWLEVKSKTELKIIDPIYNFAFYMSFYVQVPFNLTPVKVIATHF